MTRKLPTKLRALQASLTEAVSQARLAYSFSPGSYTHSALNACLLADKNFRAFRRNPLTTNRWPRCCPAARRTLRGPRNQPRLSKASSLTRWDERRDRRRGGRRRLPQLKVRATLSPLRPATTDARATLGAVKMAAYQVNGTTTRP